MLNVVVKGLAYDETGSPIILLTDDNGERVLPIWVGMLEAHSIASALGAYDVSRPLTHDLMLNLCNSMGISISKVVISDLKDNTFFAELHLLKESEKLLLDARPSDAIALAVRTGVPIFLTGNVVDQMLKIQELIDEEAAQKLEEITSDVLKEYKKTLH
jgi:hypothetical protein